MALDWIDVTQISFNALLLLEPLHIEYLAEQEPDAEMGTALKANPSVAWYFRQTHPSSDAYINGCLTLAKPDATPRECRQAEIKVMDRIQDWLVYVLDPAKYDELQFNNWDNASLLSMADFKEKVVLDIGSGTGRLAFTVAPVANVVYAVEPVAKLRRYIWEKRDRLGLDNVFPLDGTIAQIPLPEDFADIVMAGHVFGAEPAKEYEEMMRVVRDGGIILLHPGTNSTSEEDKHKFLLQHGFKFATFEEPGDGMKRKYWKTIHKAHT